MIDTYINYLIENTDTQKVYYNLDLVLDGGAFNGSYMIGCLLYLKSMEKKNFIKVDRISGCSIGALLGLSYLTDKIDIAIEYSAKVMYFFKKTQDLTFLKKYYNKIINLLIENTEVEKLNNRLFITYFDIKNKKQVVCSKYKNKNFLKKVLRKSIHIPYLIDHNMCYDDSIDGCFPFIFKERENKILFINLQTLEKLKNIFMIKNEKNVFSRILTGILDIHNFYANNKCDMCSYVNDWSIYQILIYRSKQLLFTLLCYLINLLIIVRKYIPDYLEENIYFMRLTENINNIYNDVIIYYTN